MERLHGRADKALANDFGGPGSIPNTGCRRMRTRQRKLLLNGCELHVKPYINFNFFNFNTTNNSVIHRVAIIIMV